MVNVREVLNAVFYVLSTGCQWQALPKDLPPKSTAHCYFMLWDWDGTLERLPNIFRKDAKNAGNPVLLWRRNWRETLSRPGGGVSARWRGRALPLAPVVGVGAPTTVETYATL